MPEIQLTSGRKEYDHVEVMPSGWVRCYDTRGEVLFDNDKENVTNYPPSRVQFVDGKCKYYTEK